MDSHSTWLVLVVTVGLAECATTSKRSTTTLPTTTETWSTSMDPFMTTTSDSMVERMVETFSPTDSWVSPPSPEPTTGDQLQAIKDGMLNGVEAIRDSIVGLVAFLIGGAKEVVERQVGRVVNAVERVGNKTILIKDNLASAGGAIVHTWGHSIQQTGNITGQLVNSLTDNKRLR